MKKKILVSVVLVVVLALGGFYLLQNRGNGVQFKTARVSRGDIRATVTATGTVSAVTTVLVGTQVSGTVKQIFVDYNSLVKKGQLPRLQDPNLLYGAQRNAALETVKELFQLRIDHLPVGEVSYKSVYVFFFWLSLFYVPAG